MREIKIQRDGEHAAEYQRSVGAMVGREVYCNVSGWVAEAAKAPDNADDFGIEAFDGPIDWEDVAGACDDPAVLERGDDGQWRRMGESEPVAWLDGGPDLTALDEEADESGPYAVVALDGSGGERPRYAADEAECFEDFEEACREAAEQNRVDVDDYRREIYEHWEVSSWLAARLEERGEKVIEGFGVHRVWCRTCTGQAIKLDGVICAIHDAQERERAEMFGEHYDPPPFVTVEEGGDA